MDNATVFEDLHFQADDGILNYYFYNWVIKSRNVPTDELGVVLF